MLGVEREHGCGSDGSEGLDGVGPGDGVEVDERITRRDATEPGRDVLDDGDGVAGDVAAPSSLRREKRRPSDRRARDASRVRARTGLRRTCEGSRSSGPPYDAPKPVAVVVRTRTGDVASGRFGARNVGVRRLGPALPEGPDVKEINMANDPMRILKADHREVEKLLDKLAESEEGAEREQMVDELVTKLSAHMEAEESIVYPPVKAEVGEEDEEEAEVEHGLAREGLEKVQQMVEMPGFGAAVEMLKGGISHHVEEEETQLLPELKESLDRDAWLALGDALVEAKKAAGLPVPQPPQRKSTKRTRSSRSTKSTKSKART